MSQDPRDIVADFYRANPDSFDVMSYGASENPLTVEAQPDGICPGGAMAAIGVTPHPLTSIGRNTTDRISLWCLGQGNGKNGGDGPKRTLREVLAALDSRSYPFDNETLGIES